MKPSLFFTTRQQFVLLLLIAANCLWIEQSYAYGYGGQNIYAPNNQMNGYQYQGSSAVAAAGTGNSAAVATASMPGGSSSAAAAAVSGYNGGFYGNPYTGGNPMMGAQSQGNGYQNQNGVRGTNEKLPRNSFASGGQKTLHVQARQKPKGGSVLGQQKNNDNVNYERQGQREISVVYQDRNGNAKQSMGEEQSQSEQRRDNEDNNADAGTVNEGQVAYYGISGQRNTRPQEQQGTDLNRQRGPPGYYYGGIVQSAGPAGAQQYLNTPGVPMGPPSWGPVVYYGTGIGGVVIGSSPQQQQHRRGKQQISIAKPQSNNYPAQEYRNSGSSGNQETDESPQSGSPASDSSSDPSGVEPCDVCSDLSETSQNNPESRRESPGWYPPSSDTGPRPRNGYVPTPTSSGTGIRSGSSPNLSGVRQQGSSSPIYSGSRQPSGSSPSSSGAGNRGNSFPNPQGSATRGDPPPNLSGTRPRGDRYPIPNSPGAKPPGYPSPYSPVKSYGNPGLGKNNNGNFGLERPQTNGNRNPKQENKMPQEGSSSNYPKKVEGSGNSRYANLQGPLSMDGWEPASSSSNKAAPVEMTPDRCPTMATANREPIGDSRPKGSGSQFGPGFPAYPNPPEGLQFKVVTTPAPSDPEYVTELVDIPETGNDTPKGQNKDPSLSTDELPLAAKVFAYLGTTYGCSNTRVSKEFVRLYQQEKAARPILRPNDPLYGIDESWMKLLTAEDTGETPITVTVQEAEAKIKTMEKEDQHIREEQEGLMPIVVQIFLRFVKIRGCSDSERDNYIQFNHLMNQEIRNINAQDRIYPSYYYRDKAGTSVIEVFQDTIANPSATLWR